MRAMVNVDGKKKMGALSRYLMAAGLPGGVSRGRVGTTARKGRHDRQEVTHTGGWWMVDAW